MKILFIERKPTDTVSIERVFRQIAKTLSEEGHETEFQQLPFDSTFLGMLKNLIFFKPDKADIFHITGQIHYMALALPANKTLLTIHDTRILKTRSGFRRYLIKKLLFDLPIKKLKKITAISDSTKRELLEIAPGYADKFVTIENPVFDGYSGIAGKQFNNACPTILHIGTAEHKNLPILIKALNGITCKLRIIGLLEDNILELLKINGINYELAENLNDEQMREEYQKADIISFCSLYEGFGLPILEGQCAGKPVITSDISPMKEVAGDGALLIDPKSEESIRNAICQIIDDGNLRSGLVKNGRENIRRFDPKKIAGEYLKTYKALIT